MMDVCHKQNVAEPEWKAQGGFVIVTFKRPKQNSSIPQEPPKYPSSTPQATPQVDIKYEPCTKQVETLIESIHTNFVSLTEMMELCGLKDRKSFRTEYIITALYDGAIERKYPNQPHHPKQQYRLTDKAIEWKQRKEHS